MSNVKCQMSKVEIKSGKRGDTRPIDEHFTFDLKPEKLVSSSFKVNSRFFIKSDARATTDDQTTSKKPATSQQQTSNNASKSTRTIYYRQFATLYFLFCVKSQPRLLIQKKK